MKLRTGLAAQLVALLAVASGLLGVFVERQTRTGLVAQVDERLEGALAQRLRQPNADRSPADAVAETRNGYPATATIVIDTVGNIFRSPSGVNDIADALPQVTAEWAQARIDRTSTINAVAGPLRYRARVARTPNGGLLVEAAPLRSVDASVDRLRRTLVFGGLSILLAAAIALSRLVAHSLKPLSAIAESAAVIAGGDVQRGVAVTTRYIELNQLGVALDHMVHELTAAIEERTEALAVEAASRQRLRRFAADASHELQTPVTSIRGWAELYRMGGLQEKDALSTAMSRIEREAARTGRLVDDLLLLARADEQRPLVSSPVDLVAVCHDAIAAADAIDPSRPVRFVGGEGIDGAADFVVAGDTDRLRQVIDNLLANVRAHTDSCTTVQIALRREGPNAALTVTDDGPGFPVDAMSRVFDRFWRQDERNDQRGASSPRAGGHGLGLAIVDAIIAGHGGTVRATNAEPHGAQITIALPLLDPTGCA